MRYTGQLDDGLTLEEDVAGADLGDGDLLDLELAGLILADCGLC